MVVLDMATWEAASGRWLALRAERAGL